MANISIKSEKITPFGGIFHVREHFSRFVGLVIDKVLGLRCTSFGYQSARLWDLCQASTSVARLCGGTMASDGQGCQSPSWQRTLCSCC